MITDHDIARLCVGIYDYPGKPPVEWHYKVTGNEAADSYGVCWALARLDGFDVVVFRGSVTILDWVRDLEALAWRPIEHPRLGFVHSGFLRHMPDVWTELRPNIKQPVVVAGHSLGAGRASIMAGLMTVDGVPPVARVVFGEPRPGFTQLRDILQVVPGRSYRNGDGKDHDPITDVPLRMGPLQYYHPTPMIDVYGPPPESDAWGPFRFHHMPHYEKELQPPGG